MMLRNVTTREIETPQPRIDDSDDHAPGVGTVLDGQYRLIRELEPVSGRPCFLADELCGSHRVELVLTNTSYESRRQRYIVRRRAIDQVTRRAPAVPRPPIGLERPAEPIDNRAVDDRAMIDRAMSTFQSRVTLSGVCVRKGDKLVFNGWDRESHRPVRVTVEPAG